MISNIVGTLGYMLFVPYEYLNIRAPRVRECDSLQESTRDSHGGKRISLYSFSDPDSVPESSFQAHCAVFHFIKLPDTLERGVRPLGLWPTAGPDTFFFLAFDSVVAQSLPRFFEDSEFLFRAMAFLPLKLSMCC